MRILNVINMRNILDTSKITKSGQITLKKEIREKLKVKKGEKIVFLEVNGDVVIKSAKEV